MAPAGPRGRLAVALGAAATRITHSELMATRREAARDRAEQAQAYRDLTVARTAEHKSFADTMRTRIDAQETCIHELEVALSSAQKRAAEASRKFNAEARRADLAEDQGRATAGRLAEAEERAAQAIVLVAELEQELDVLRAELAAWHATPARRHDGPRSDRRARSEPDRQPGGRFVVRSRPRSKPVGRSGVGPRRAESGP